MADITVSNDVDALMRSADNAEIVANLALPSAEAILNPLVEGQGLLNSFVGSAAAYSLRDLNKTNPDVVEVRRASDETSRVFKANEIGSTLENWVNAEVALPLDTTGHGLKDHVNFSNPDTTYYTCGSDITIGANATWKAEVEMVIDTFANYVLPFGDNTWANGVGIIFYFDGKVRVFSKNSPLSQQPSGIKLGVPFNVEYGYDGTSIYVKIDGTIVYSDSGVDQSGSVTSQWKIGGGSNLADQPCSIHSAKLTVNDVVVRDYQAMTASSTLTDSSASSEDATLVGNIGDVTDVTVNYGPAAAYSLRNLSTSYSGNVVDVRRSSDDTEASFTAAEVAGSTMVNWVGVGNDGHVTKWYDQSGNDNHAVQATPASQPKVVDGGTLVADGLKFDEAQSLGVTGNPVITSAYTGTFSGFSVQKVANDNGYVYSNNSLSNGWAVRTEEYTLRLMNKFSGGDTMVQSVNTTQLVSFVYNNGTSGLLVNGQGTVTAGTYDFPASTNDFTIGSRAGGSSEGHYLDGTISEIIIYDSDQTDNRKAIESNMADYHGNIDLPAGFDSGNDEVDGYVATWYDQSGNGNNAVQAVATSQPKIVEGGVLVTDGLKFDGVDDYLRPSNDVITDIKNAAAFVVFNPTTTSGFLLSLQYSSRFYVTAATSTTGANNVIKTAPTEAGTTYLRTVTTSGSSATLFSNSEIQGASSNITEGTYGFSPTIGAHQQGSSGKLDGAIQEILIYDSDQSAFRKNIEFNINNAYSIY